MSEREPQSSHFEAESAKGPEALSPEFIQAVQAVRLQGDQLMEKNHGSGPEADPKVMHSPEHPQNMQERAQRLARAINASPEEQALAELAISFHDTIIKYDPADPNNIVAMIKRHRGAQQGDMPKGENGNEGLSGIEAVAKMSGHDVFSNDHQKRVREAIDATYPDVNAGKDWKGLEFSEHPHFKEVIQSNKEIQPILSELEADGITKGALFWQPHLEKPLEKGETVPKEVLLVALSDLGTAGMDEYEKFREDGNGEFQELYANIPKNLSRLMAGDASQDQKERADAAAAMLGWKKSQPAFAAHQMLRTERIVMRLEKNGELDSAGAKALRHEFSRFPANIRASVAESKQIKMEYDRLHAEEGEKEAFRYLALQMGYKGEHANQEQPKQVA